MLRSHAPTLGVFLLIGFPLLSGCASDEAARTNGLHAAATQLRAQVEDPEIQLRMQQEAMRRYPDIVAQMERLHAEHRIITAPRMTRATTPKYPFSNRFRDIQGAVWVSFVVSPEGLPTRIEAMTGEGSLSDPAFAASAVEAVSHWQFTPARADGEPIFVIQCVPVVFQLQ